jgi:hypothetical protein
MAFEKRYTAKQAAEAVLKKTQELLAASGLAKAEELNKGEWNKIHRKLEAEGYSKESADKIDGSIKAKMNKYEPTGSKKENSKPNEHHSKDADQHAEGAAPKGEIHPHEQEAAPKDGTETQPAPGNNPKEQAEGNNELAGTTPTQVGQDGKNIAGADEMKGHYKLAKFIGHMEAKRKMRGV